MKKGDPYPVESMIEDLRAIIVELEEETFSGVLLYSCHSKAKAWAQIVHGNAEDRLAMIDAALMSMYHEPLAESRDWFFSQVYERFKSLRPTSLVESNRSIA